MQVRTLQSQRQGGRGGVAEVAGSGAGGRGDGRHPSVKEAKKAEMEAWLATEIEVMVMCRVIPVACTAAFIRNMLKGEREFAETGPWHRRRRLCVFCVLFFQTRLKFRFLLSCCHFAGFFLSYFLLLGGERPAVLAATIAYAGTYSYAHMGIMFSEYHAAAAV